MLRRMGREILDLAPAAADVRIEYGNSEHEFAELRLPAGPGPHPVAVVIHGGFWRAAYNLDHMGHLCAALAKLGIATWNLEYRRIGHTGGGWPGTGADVLKGAGKLVEIADDYALRTDRVIAIGYSAGGQLALWLATQKLPFRMRGVVSLAGVTDLRRAFELELSNCVVRDFMGTADYCEASPIELLPFGMPTRLVHGTEDASVPPELSVSFVERAVALGDDSQLVGLGGATHYDPIDPESAYWPDVERTVLDLIGSYHQA